MGCNKTDNSRWYEENVPTADALFDEYLRELAMREVYEGDVRKPVSGRISKRD